MWNYDEKDIEKDVTATKYLDKSGCYIAKIVSIEHKKTTNGNSQAIFKIEVDDVQYNIYHCYEGKNRPIDFKVRVLNHILYLNKLTKPDDIKKIEGKTIGVMLKAKLSQDGKFINFDLEDVYHPTLKKTCKEIKENSTALIVTQKQQQYDAEPKLTRNKTFNSTEQTTDDSEEFPF